MKRWGESDPFLMKNVHAKVKRRNGHCLTYDPDVPIVASTESRASVVVLDVVPSEGAVSRHVSLRKKKLSLKKFICEFCRL